MQISVNIMIYRSEKRRDLAIKGLYKQRSTKQATDTSYLKKNNGNTKKLIFSFNIINSVKKSVLHFLITNASPTDCCTKDLIYKAL